MPGPARKPTALTVIDGNRGKRATNKQEPDPEYLAAGDLAPPAWLPKDAKKVWNEVVPALQKARLVAVIDIEYLAHGCAAAALCRKATKKVHASATVAGQEGKGDSLSPWLIVQSMSFKQVHAVFPQFGIGPAARTRIALQPQMDLFGAEAPSGKEDKAGKYFAKA